MNSNNFSLGAVEWPILNNGQLTHGALSRLQGDLPSITMFTKGMNVASEAPAVCFEMCRFVKHAITQQRAPLHAIVCVSTTELGSVVRIAWRYPQVLEFDSGCAQAEAFRVFRMVAEAVYGPREWGITVREFVTRIETKYQI